MNKQKTMIMGSLAMAVLLAGSVFSAQASTTKSSHHKSEKGTVQSVSSDSLSLKTKHKTYKVNISSTSKLEDKTGKVIKLSDIKKDDTVKAKGSLTGTTLTATSVKELTR